MNEQQEKFCEKCGSVLAEFLTGYYDRFTGEPKRKKHCINLFCQVGCSYSHGGHIWGKLWKLENWDTCQRCGYNATNW